MNKKSVVFSLVGFVLGALAVWLLLSFGTEQGAEGSSDSKSKKAKEPLYWVAPMDANYRRDNPGKSPMGMDLVPVYEEGAGADDSPGTVKIDPNVINNLSVKTGVARKGSLVNNVKTVGYVTYDETKITRVHTRTDGWIEKLFVNHSGQRIEAGQPLFTMYSPALVNAQQEYLLAKKRNNNSLLMAAKQRLDSLSFDAKELKKLNQRGKPLQNVTFYAKSSGLVEQLDVREGAFLQPGTRLMTIGNLDTVWVEVELFERQLPYIKVGQDASIALDYLPAKSWQGTVDYIYPIVNPNNRTAKVRLEVQNPQHELKANMFAEVSIDTATTEQVLQVPKQAVIRTEDNNRVVLALGEGKFKSVGVTLGRTTNDNIEVLDGLVEGDEVVLSGQFLIDSESSIESDFKRFAEQHDHGNDHGHDMKMSIPSARVSGLINSVDVDSNTVNISRGAIEKWNREPMTMDFELDSSLSIDLFVVGENIDFTFEIRDEGFFITEVHSSLMEHDHD
ncbi:efflux RND transporter periplasmic adaptor subunit [Kangiella japonica]|uniref:Efflux RND transporter periplasmic adaptor subunit n=1 Tax=Kangiella japonica TaxID=647384 RepID=A0ABP3CPJ3_9GAMM